MSIVDRDRLSVDNYAVSPPPQSGFGPQYTPQVVAAVAGCSAAISALNARICGTPVAGAWARRASWSGYARGLLLQSAELDESDVFAWGCGLPLPGRRRQPTHVDLFDRFAEWQKCLADPDPLAWRDAQPLARGEPDGAADHPALVRALDAVRRQARLDGSIMPWLSLPFVLRDRKLTATPLPCLAGGVKAFRLKKVPQDADWLAALRALEKSAAAGLERLHALERIYRSAQRALVAEYRPGMLPALLALTCYRPLLSPQAVSSLLGLSLAGASKLLERAAGTGLLVEITQRRSWRQFLAADLAVEFGFARAARGRPAKEPPPLPPSKDIAAVFDEFDQAMAEIDRLMASSRMRENETGAA